MRAEGKGFAVLRVIGGADTSGGLDVVGVGVGWRVGGGLGVGRSLWEGDVGRGAELSRRFAARVDVGFGGVLLLDWTDAEVA